MEEWRSVGVEEWRSEECRSLQPPTYEDQMPKKGIMRSVFCHQQHYDIDLHIRTISWSCALIGTISWSCALIGSIIVWSPHH